MSELLIRNGHAIDPAAGIDALRDILIRNGQVAAVEVPGTFGEAGTTEGIEVLDASGLIVAPGLIDIHVHLREPGQTYKETIASGTAAAAAGGFTTVVAMPNTLPVNDSAETMQWILAPERHPLIQLLAMPAATVGSLGERLTNFVALARAGAAGFTDDGKPILEAAVMRAALIAAARLGLPISQHAEDTRMTGGCTMNAGPVAFRLGLRGMTVEAEWSIVERDIQLLRDIEENEGRSEDLRPHLHVQHVSTARALEAIRRAKRQGLHVTCEATPHHFSLTDEAVAAGGPDCNIAYDTNAKMNPPLRSERDRQAVLAALQDGTVDCIATDHAPHAAHEKEQEFERTPNGILGLETALGLALRVLHREQGMSLPRVLALMTANPAAIIQQQSRATLAPGGHADLVLFNPTTEWNYNVAHSRSKSRNTPFDQASLLGQIHTTISEGRIVYQASVNTPVRS